MARLPVVMRQHVSADPAVGRGRPLSVGVALAAISLLLASAGASVPVRLSGGAIPDSRHGAAAAGESVESGQCREAATVANEQSQSMALPQSAGCGEAASGPGGSGGANYGTGLLVALAITEVLAAVLLGCCLLSVRRLNREIESSRAASNSLLAVIGKLATPVPMARPDGFNAADKRIRKALLLIERHRGTMGAVAQQAPPSAAHVEPAVSRVGDVSERGSGVDSPEAQASPEGGVGRQ